MLKLRGTSISLLFLLLSFFLMRTACRGRGRAKTTTSHELVFSFLFFFFFSVVVVCVYVCVCVYIPLLEEKNARFHLRVRVISSLPTPNIILKKKKGKANCASDEMESSFESVLVYLQYRKRKKKKVTRHPTQLIDPSSIQRIQPHACAAQDHAAES